MLSIYVLTYHSYIFHEISIRFLCPFVIEVFVLLLLKNMNYLQSFIKYMIYRFFFQFVACLFIFLMMSFEAQSFKFFGSICPFVLFRDNAFGVLFKNFVLKTK